MFRALSASVCVPLALGALACGESAEDPTAPPGLVLEPVQSELFSAPGAQPNAWADYDNDGDLDLFVGFRGAPDRLYRNEIASYLGVDDLAAIGTPEKVGPRFGRDLPAAAGFRKGRHVKLKRTRIIGRICKPSTVGRDHAKSFIELGLAIRNGLALPFEGQDIQIELGLRMGLESAAFDDRDPRRGALEFGGQRQAGSSCADDAQVRVDPVPIRERASSWSRTAEP